MRNLLLVWLFISGVDLSAQSVGLEKCSPLLYKKIFSERDNSSQSALFTIQVKDVDSFKNVMLPNGVRVISEYLPSGILLIECPAGFFFSTVLPHSGVTFADVGRLTGDEEIIVPGHNLFANQIRRTLEKRPELDGQGTVISIKEFGFDTTDVDFRNRIVPNDQQMLETRVHASIMATLAAGAGNADPAGGGVARGSRLFHRVLPDCCPMTMRIMN